MVSMMRITGVEISKKSKCAKQTAFSKNFKSLKIIYTLFAHDAHDAHYAYDAHHRSRNFEKVEMRITNSSFEKFEITVNLIYTVCAMSEMII